MSSSEGADRRTGAAAPDDIAIVGMACIFPGAPNLDEYWQNIVGKVDAISGAPADVWDADVFYDPAATTNDRVYCKRGGYVSAYTQFDPMANGVMPLAVAGGEPDQWLALQIARAALADAGYADEIPERRRTAVILGRGTHLNRGNLTILQHGAIIDQTLGILKTLHPEYTPADLELIRQDLKRKLPPFNADTAPGLVPNIISGRIANRLDLMGPNYTVDGACASSLLAVEAAVRGLHSREYDMALVGGVHVVTPAPVLMLFCQLGALSRTEQIRPFDKSADGTLLGGGLGMVVLKRRADAERDGQRIYACIKGVGVASDGRGLSVMAPRLEGEVLALERAYEGAGISPRTVELIEAHGTGTPVGDATEIEALGRVFGPRQEGAPWCGVGTVKSMIGHAMPAAGMAGLIKAALSLHHKVLPPTLHVEEPNPELELEKTPFYLNTETRPWIHGAAETPRRAGVNSFGFGGINAHVILEEHSGGRARPALEAHALPFESEVCILTAASRPELVARVEEVLEFLSSDSTVALRDLAYTLNVPLREGPFRLAAVAGSMAELQQKLERARERLSDPSCQKIKEVAGLYFFAEPLKPAGRLAFLFPGEGSQYVNMLADLCLRFPEVRQCFDAMDAVFANHPRHWVPSDVIFPRPSFSADERAAAEARLWQMEGAFEAVVTATRALSSVLARLDIHPDALVGHSTGEYAAMHAAGMMDLADEERLARFATELNQYHHQQLAGGREAPPATLVAVGGDAATVSALVENAPGRLHVAMQNCPHQTVVLGAEEDVAGLIEELGRRGLLYERLPFDRPYHTPLFEVYAEGLQSVLDRWLVAAPRLPLYSCTTHSPFPEDLKAMRRLAVQHWMRPVEFQKTVEAMYADGVRLFVEVGPRGNLSAFVEDTLRGRPHVAVAADSMSRPGITQLNHLVGLLAAHGVAMRLDYLYERRSPRKVALAGRERAEQAAADRAKKGRPMKLEIGWIPLVLSEETAAQLRAKAPAASAPPPVSPPPTARTVAAPTNGKAGGNGKAPPEPLAARAASPAIAPPSPVPANRGATAAVAGHGIAPNTGAAEPMSAYWRTMDQFLTMQQDVMQAFLTGRSPAPVAAEQVLRTPPIEAWPASPAPPPPPPAVSVFETRATVAPVIESSPGPAPVTPPAHAALAEKPAGATALDANAIGHLLLKIVGERTGYPVDMIDLDLDLEADLGIDSIKRVEILGSFQQQTGLMKENDMEALAGRKTLRQVGEFLSARAQGETAPARPFVGEIVSLVPGRQLVARRVVRLDEDLFLRDHLGHQVSVTDPDLTSLAVMPLTMSMEMMAEAAAVLVPDARFIGMREVRAHRWITLETETLSLRLVATASGSKEREVAVQVFEDGADGSPSGGPAVEGTMVFGDAYPEPPAAGPFALRRERPSKWAPGALYADVMFHGPAFRGVVSMDRCGEDGATATLQVLPSSRLFRSSTNPALLTDPILLDQPGQVVGFWTAECLDRAYVIFPFRLEALHLYGPSPAVATRLECQARIVMVGEQQIRSDLDIVAADGHLVARLVGWWDQRFDVPRSLIHFLQAPRDIILGEPWPLPVEALPGPGSFRAHRIRLDAFPKGFFTSHGGVWQRPLAHLVLSRRERELWRGLETPEPRRLLWLLGRVAAKTALRLHLEERYGLVVSPADIEILPDADGRPVPAGAWTRDVVRVPIVSVSHTDGVAMAVVADDDTAAGDGGDLEHAGRLQDAADLIAATSLETHE
jgi:acyl transferase domain-containing protein/acyl carrier protein